MKARLKVLPDQPRGVAWPSSARGVNCPIKFGNERDPCAYLPLLSFLIGSTIGGLPALSRRKERATVGQYGPNLPGYTWPTMRRTMGCHSERRSQSLNLRLVRIEGWNSPS